MWNVIIVPYTKRSCAKAKERLQVVKIKDIRVEQNISQAQLALDAGISVSVLSHMENGKGVRKGSLIAVCSVLGIDWREVEGVKIHSAVQAAAMRKRMG